jgi:hypothetical protein
MALDPLDNAYTLAPITFVYYEDPVIETIEPSSVVPQGEVDTGHHCSTSVTPL